jgi:hypothetical protein
VSPVTTNGLLSTREGELELIDRRGGDFGATFPTEVLTCRVQSGGEVELLVKRAEGIDHYAYGHRGGVAYEALVYAEVLEPLGLSTPKLYAWQADGDPGEAWLAIEYLRGVERLNRCADANETLVRAAGWIGRFHAASASMPADRLNLLRAYDAAYYSGWSRRTLEFAEDGERRYPWLPQLCERFEDEWAPALAAGRVTAIHGELYPRNILVREGSVYPIDWESAALAAGEIDLVALIDGWPDEVVERALAAYLDERWGGQAPADFERLCDAARLYVGFRWLGDRPYWTNLDSSQYDFRALRATGRRLGLVA